MKTLLIATFLFAIGLTLGLSHYYHQKELAVIEKIYMVEMSRLTNLCEKKGQRIPSPEHKKVNP